MKKFLSVILCFILIFLCSCSILPKVTETADITLEQLENKTIQNIAVNDKYLLILASDYEAEYEECYDEDYDEVEDPNINYYFYLWNINFNKLKAEYSSSSEEFDYISDIQLTDDNKITVYCFNDEPVSKIYDFKFNQIGTTNETAQSIMDANEKLVKENELIDENRYAICNNVAYSSNYIENDLIVFLDDSQNIFISKNDKNSNIIECLGRKVYSIDNTQDKTIKYSCTDYENYVTKEISIKCNTDCYPADIAIGNTYSAITIQNETGQINDITIINNNALTEKPANDIEKININEIDNKVTELENEVKDSYDIDIESYIEYDENSTINYYVYDNDFSKSELLLTLFDLKYCLSTFPKELYKEIKNQNENTNSFEKFKLYIIGNFDDEKNDISIGGYCSNKDGELFIVYSVSAFNRTTFYHEFMHAIEYRIWDYVSDYEEEWIKLNPTDFEYTYGDKNIMPYYDNEEFQNYFANDYGTTNSLEDRATIFQEICASAFCDEENPYWAEKEPIVKKAKYLRKIITKSFPSLSDENFLVWKMYGDILK